MADSAIFNEKRNRVIDMVVNKYPDIIAMMKDENVSIDEFNNYINFVNDNPTFSSKHDFEEFERIKNAIRRKGVAAVMFKSYVLNIQRVTIRYDERLSPIPAVILHTKYGSICVSNNNCIWENGSYHIC